MEAKAVSGPSNYFEATEMLAAAVKRAEAAEARVKVLERERDDLNAQATRALTEAGMPPPDGGYVGREQLLWADIGRLAYLKDELKKDVSRAASLCRVAERERDEYRAALRDTMDDGAFQAIEAYRDHWRQEADALRARVEALEDELTQMKANLALRVSRANRAALEGEPAGKG